MSRYSLFREAVHVPCFMLFRKMICWSCVKVFTGQIGSTYVMLYSV